MLRTSACSLIESWILVNGSALREGVSRVEMKANTYKSRVVTMTEHRALSSCINGQSVEGVFVYIFYI